MEIWVSIPVLHFAIVKNRRAARGGSVGRKNPNQIEISRLGRPRRRPGPERGQVPACTEAGVVPECQALGRLLTQERAAAAAELRVSQSDQSGGGGSTACTQESCGGVSSFCRKKSLRSIILQNPSIKVAYSLTYQSTHWGIRSIGSERYTAPKGAQIGWLHGAGVLATKVGYFGAKSTNVCQAQMGTKPA
eukprot:scaffold4848_cov59-Phaeocystis_antarctica.AAC.3